MMKVLAILCIGSALVALGECQDMTSLMFQALGIDAPPMPPIMPQTLREHLYPMQRQQELLRQQQLVQQKQRYLAYLAAQQQHQAKENPYSAPYTTNARVQPRDNSVFSPANIIRQPGAANSVSSFKGNPYSIPYQNGAARKVSNVANPYSVSRAAGSPIPGIRNRASMSPVPLPPQAVKMLKTMKVMRDQPRRITDAKAAGCKLPVEGLAASVMLFNDCRNPTARMLCQADMMTCMNVGMAAMCCPFGVNNLAMDTLSYVNKLQQYMSEIA